MARVSARNIRASSSTVHALFQEERLEGDDAVPHHPHGVPERPPGRVLVFLKGGIGDVVFALPLLGDLRAGFPGSELVALSHDQGADVLRHAPAVDTVRSTGPLSARSSVEDALRALGPGRFDVAVTPVRSARAAWLLSARARAPGRASAAVQSACCSPTPRRSGPSRSCSPGASSGSRRCSGCPPARPRVCWWTGRRAMRHGGASVTPDVKRGGRWSPSMSGVAGPPSAGRCPMPGCWWSASRRGARRCCWWVERPTGHAHGRLPRPLLVPRSTAPARASRTRWPSCRSRVRRWVSTRGCRTQGWRWAFPPCCSSARTTRRRSSRCHTPGSSPSPFPAVPATAPARSGARRATTAAWPGHDARPGARGAGRGGRAGDEPHGPLTDSSAWNHCSAMRP